MSQWISATPVLILSPYLFQIYTCIYMYTWMCIHRAWEWPTVPTDRLCSIKTLLIAMMPAGLEGIWGQLWLATLLCCKNTWYNRALFFFPFSSMWCDESENKLILLNLTAFLLVSFDTVFDHYDELSFILPAWEGVSIGSNRHVVLSFVIFAREWRVFEFWCVAWTKEAIYRCHFGLYKIVISIFHSFIDTMIEHSNYQQINRS